MGESSGPGDLFARPCLDLGEIRSAPGSVLTGGGEDLIRGVQSVNGGGDPPSAREIPRSPYAVAVGFFVRGGKSPNRQLRAVEDCAPSGFCRFGRGTLSAFLPQKNKTAPSPAPKTSVAESWWGFDRMGGEFGKSSCLPRPPPSLHAKKTIPAAGRADPGGGAGRTCMPLGAGVWMIVIFPPGPDRRATLREPRSARPLLGRPAELTRRPPGRLCCPALLRGRGTAPTPPSGTLLPALFFSMLGGIGGWSFRG